VTAGRWALLAGALLAAARVAAAQDSQLGIRGLGTPGRAESARARSAGGAFAAFDPTSAVSEVALADVRELTVTAVGGSSFRTLDVGGTSTDLRATRFPLFIGANAFGKHLVVSLGFASYLDRSYDVVTRDSVVLNGAQVPYNDETASDGGVTDVRLAAASRLGARFAVGLGIHALTGSARITATRTFDDTITYATVRDTEIVRYTGLGVSASARLDVTPHVAMVGFARTDTRCGALRLVLSPSLRVAGSVTWRDWSSAGPDAYNTLNWSAGAELGGRSGGLRLGARGGQLPFGPGGSAPSEWGVSAGMGRSFAGGHGILDLGAERLTRSGAGLTEHVWTLLVGLTVQQ
jgi:hypothetical protein